MNPVFNALTGYLGAHSQTIHLSAVYRKNSNIIRTIFTTNTGLVAGVCIIHVN